MSGFVGRGHARGGLLRRSTATRQPGCRTGKPPKKVHTLRDWPLLALPVILAACNGVKQPRDTTTGSTACDFCGGDCEDQTQAIAGFAHVTGDVVYADPPPTSGNHSACWTTWGVHETDPGDEHWVHNEEHGGVVILYQPSDCTAVADTGSGTDSTGATDCTADVSALATTLGAETDPRWIITPYDALPVAWAAVSWGQRRMMGCFDVGAFQQFFEQNVAHGREDVSSEPPSSCP